MKKIIRKIKGSIVNFRAVFFIMGLTSVSIVGVLIIFNISINNNFQVISRSSLSTAQRAFTHFEINTCSMLSATLKALLNNKEIANVFIERDREKLHRQVFPLFKQLKNRNNISHWYFINPEPENTCFLRVHAPPVYNDTISRITLSNCIESKRISLGKELGKTAFALRAVYPYYHRDKLIGYMELAVDMDNFFNMLKVQTGNEYALFIKKKYLAQTKWQSVSAQKKIADNWDSMENLLMIYKTFKEERTGEYLDIVENIENIPGEGIALEKTEINGKYYVRGVFPFYDADGRKIGGVFVLKDSTPIIKAMEKQKKKILLIILGFMSAITFFMVFFHKRAETELKKYRSRLEELVTERTVELTTINKQLNKEILEHKRDQLALKEECIAREEAEQKQVEAVKQLERSARLASIGVMAAGITHEINQPLNAIKVTADSIQFWSKRNPGALPEMFIEQQNIISQSVKRIVEIIGHMRAFWVVPQAPAISAVDINKAVKNALSLTGQQLFAHGIKERLELAKGPLIVNSNLVHLEQIVINLLVNAVHAHDQKDQDNKEIKIISNKQEQWVELLIRDNGPGLPSDDPEKLFDPFFSTRNHNESMGLGLAIVKRYIDRYDGTIEVFNNPGAGASFKLRFPLTESN